MENSKCGCDEEQLIESKEDSECRCGEEQVVESKEDTGCGVEDNHEVNLTEEESGCGCGATEYPDQSRIHNADKPKFLADDSFIKEFEDYAHLLGVESIGYTQLTPELLIKDKFIQYPHAIVLTMEMDREIIETAPGPEAKRLNDSAYAKLADVTYKLSDYLRENGFATEVAHPYENIVNFSPLAQKAGLGWMGKNGLIITPELGPGQKISAILVSIANLPGKDRNEHSWIPGYCDICGKCAKACPEEALIQKGHFKEDKEIDFVPKLCIGCSQGCTYCIEDCPFNEKGYEHVKNKFDKMNAKLIMKNENEG